MCAVILLNELFSITNISLCSAHIQSQSSYGPVLSPMNKVHGGMNKLPSVNQLVGQPNQHNSNAAPGMMPMGKHEGWLLLQIWSIDKAQLYPKRKEYDFFCQVLNA